MDFDQPSSREEALRRLEERAGPVARKMLEKFLTQVEKLEADQAGSALSTISGNRCQLERDQLLPGSAAREHRGVNIACRRYRADQGCTA